MRISHKHKFVFIAIPKTGSTSVRKNLDRFSNIRSKSDKPPYNYHGKAKEVKKHFCQMDWQWEDYYKFTFVRNTYERICSEYEWRLKHFPKFPRLTFTEYVNHIESIINFENPGDIYPEHLIDNIRTHLQPQYTFIYSDNGECLIDYVGKYETLQSSYSNICNKLYIPPKNLPWRNRTSRKPCTHYYNKETKDIITRLYIEDIERFDYQFPDNK